MKIKRGICYTSVEFDLTPKDKAAMDEFFTEWKKPHISGVEAAERVQRRITARKRAAQRDAQT